MTTDLLNFPHLRNPMQSFTETEHILINNTKNGMWFPLVNVPYYIINQILDVLSTKTEDIKGFPYSRHPVLDRLETH